MRYLIYSLLIFFAAVIHVSGQQREQAFLMNERLGRGINLGNCFEAPKETEWGNPWNPEYFRIMAQLGFKHVRIPIRWETVERSSATPPYTIQASFLNRIKQVVDTALKYKLHAIINMHHHDSLIANPDREKARFLSQWGQIAQFFRNYSDSLLFEVLNEPNGNFSATKWNTFFSDALGVIRQTNPTRFVVMGVAEWGGLAAISSLQIPADQNLLMTIHYYNPFQFTHQGAEWVGSESQSWLGTKWYSTEAERQTILTEFSYALQFSKEKHIPIHIGEFGAYSKADEASRVRWTTYLSRWFESQGFSWAYWEFSAGFGIYNPSTKKILTPLADALLKNQIPPATPVQVTPVYTSNFTSGNDGWSLYSQQGAAASLSRSDSKLIVTISNGGTESWHVQLTKGGLKLEQGKTYRVSFKAKSTADRSAVFYTGKSVSPWSAYGDYHTIQLSTSEVTFSFSFTMKDTTDTKTRVVFDLGAKLPGITIAEFKVEEITILTFTGDTGERTINLFPNPFTDLLTIDNNSEYTAFELIYLTGKNVMKGNLVQGANHLNTSGLPTGLYVLRITAGLKIKTFKIIRM
jgi:endoglucanase